MKYSPILIPVAILTPMLWLSSIGEEKQPRALTTEEKIASAITPDTPKVKPKKKRTLLVFSRTMGYRHKSIDTGKKALAILGNKTGAFDVIISDDLKNFQKPNINQFDAICFLNTTRNVFKGATNEAELKENFLEFIANGNGFVGIHSATDTFQSWPAYGEMIGGYFDGHPWNAGNNVVIDVEKGMEQSPMTKMIKNGRLEFKEEIYQHRAPYDSSKVNMILRLNTELSEKNVKGIKRTDNDFGVSWYRSYGEEDKGRVFYCTLGHNDNMFWNEEVLGHYLAGIQYALGDLDDPKGAAVEVTK